MLVRKMSLLPDPVNLPKIIALDTETLPDGSIEGLSFAYLENKKIKSFYIPINHSDIVDPYDNMDFNRVVSYVKRLCSKRSVIFQNAQFDLAVLKNNFDIEIADKYIEDTMLMHYTLDTERYHGLKDIMHYEYGKDVMKYEQAKNLGFGTFVKYADNDARFTLFLYYKLLKEFANKEKSYLLYRNYEIPFIRVLLEMNWYKNFIRIDEPLLYHYNEIIADELFLIDDMIKEKLGDINAGSSKQLGEALEAKGYNVARTKKGNYSTGEKELVNLYRRQKGMVLSLILYFRGIAKQENTYIRPTYERLIKIDKNVFVIKGYDFAHIGTRSGRMSAHNPNLQNQPRNPIIMKLLLLSELRKLKLTNKEYMLDNEFEKFLEKHKDDSNVKKLINKYSVDMRRIFIAMPGKKFIGADFSQIELRMMAHLSKDENMSNAFRDGKDIHIATAEEVTKMLDGKFVLDRQGAKAFNFGLIYGLFHTTIAENLRIPKKQAKAFYDAYFDRYSGVRDFINAVHKSARQSHYVQTILGRRRNMNTLGINARDMDYENRGDAFKKRKYAENSSVSTIVSGSSADLIKIAMLNIYAKYKNEMYIKIQVHDELLIEVDENKADKYAEIVKEEMESAMKLSVPVVAEVATGSNWRDVH